MLDRNQDVFSRHKAEIGCCNVVEQKIELEESSVSHREGAGRMTLHKPDECRKEETLLDYDMIEPSKSRWACEVVMAKKETGFRYLINVTVKDAYPMPRIDRGLSKLVYAEFFFLLLLI